jgi:hypothetical protein
MNRETLLANLRQAPICSRPIFILGSFRSGTNALAYALARHSQLATLGESEILFHLFRDDPVDKMLKLLGQRPLPTWVSTYGVERAEILAFLGLGVNALFTSKNIGKRWIDKTPHYMWIRDILLELFPDALFLHLVRDGRRVVHSMIHFLDGFPEEQRAFIHSSGQAPPWARDFREACRTWKRFMVAGMGFCAKHPSRCLTVVNEQLVDDSAKGFRDIFRFLQVPDEEQPIHFFRTKRIFSSFRQPVTTSPISPASCQLIEERLSGVAKYFVEAVTFQASEPWTEWSAEQRRIFAEEAGDVLVRHGMAPSAEIAGW